MERNVLWRQWRHRFGAKASNYYLGRSAVQLGPAASGRAALRPKGSRLSEIKGAETVFHHTQGAHYGSKNK
jgi:hypothetical protein